MNGISAEAIRALQESFGSRFVAPAASEENPGELLASVYPQSIGEVKLLATLAARYHVPLVARGAGTALYVGKTPQALAVRFDAMRQIRFSEPGESWVEVEPGVTWMGLEERLGERGMGPTVYPTSAPKATVGGWLAENGVGVGSYEYGWLLQNVLRVEVVQAGGKTEVIEGEALRHFVGSRGSMGFLVRARLATRPAGADLPVAAAFGKVKDLAGAVLDLYRGGTPLWHLGFLNGAMVRARGLEEGHLLFGVYPEERVDRVEPALHEAANSYGGRLLGREEADRLWGERFFPIDPAGPTPTPGRAFVQGARLGEVLVEVERKLAGVAIQGTVTRMGEVSLLAFDPAREEGTGLVDLAGTADIELVRVAGRSWMPPR